VDVEVQNLQQLGYVEVHDFSWFSLSNWCRIITSRYGGRGGGATATEITSWLARGFSPGLKAMVFACD
jgi:hypothetical protein